ELYGVRGRITGLKVLRPENAPDEWQKRALIQLEAGADEVISDAEINGKPYHRLMRPMYMKPGCEKCHGHLGFKLGDFRGGVSVSVPLTPYINAKQDGTRMLAISHGLIWALGLAGIGFGTRQIKRRMEERDRAGHQLHAHRARFETLLNLAPDAFIVMDLNYRITMFSQGAVNVFGYQLDEVLGERIEMLMPEELRPAHAESVQRFANEGSPTRLAGDRIEISGRRKDGYVFPAEASIACLTLDGEEVFTATFRDISERRERDEMLQQAQRMEAIGQLTGGIAHDFNNLLAVIHGNLSLMDMELPQDSELRQLTTPALNAVDRGASLTQRLLAFSRRQALQVTAVDAGELLSGLNEMLSRSLGEDINIELEIAPDLWLCDADVGQLEQAILNLANNARDAMPSGGCLTIEAANTTLDSQTAGQIDNAEPGDYVIITFGDEGTGIPAEALERIFEPFFTTKESGKGTGLGLSMVYGFVAQSGGFVLVDTKQNKGTRIALNLPRHTDAATDRAPKVEIVPKAATTGKKVLVVDDDPDVRTLVARLVARQGYETLAAGSGSEALTLLDDGVHIDLLLTDVILNDRMNGAELAREAEAKMGGLKIIFMSGYTGDALAERIEMDASATILRKPFRHAELADSLRRAFEQST
ncbi:MAG: PAS domain S-box protein, partial [Rhodospirillaceae bacterium]|nr:PAS domain S-box protein [Rhodospirillaceae bacterium]